MKPALIVAVLAAAACGCSSGKDLAEARGAVNAFHHQLDAGQFAQIYAAAAPDLKGAATEADFVALLAAVHRKLGPLQSASPLGWNVNYTTGGGFVTLNYQSAFQGGQAQESFTYRLENGAPKLAGYHVASNALILK